MHASASLGVSGRIVMMRPSCLSPPGLNANATYTRLDADRVLGDQVILPANIFAANLMLSVPLVSPRAWADTTRAKDNRELAKLSYADTRRGCRTRPSR